MGREGGRGERKGITRGGGGGKGWNEIGRETGPKTVVCIAAVTLPLCILPDTIGFDQNVGLDGDMIVCRGSHEYVAETNQNPTPVNIGGIRGHNVLD